jgi:hypothetical protein
MNRSILRAALAAVLFACGGILSAQTSAPSATPATAPSNSSVTVSTPPGPPPELKVTLMDGTVLTGKFSTPELTVETKFGALKVPIDEIQAFAPGIKSHPEFSAKLNDLVNDLAADAFADREKAQQQILKMGPEIKGELDRLVKTADAEKQMRLQKIIEEFESQRDEDADVSRDWKQDDTIVTQNFTIVGRIVTPGFSVASPYGTLAVKIKDIRMAKRDAAEPEEIRKSITVPGSTLSQHNFITSSIRVNKGDTINVTASGTVTMTPWGNNNQCGPDGNQRYGTVMNNIYSGTLVARIAGGDMIKVGSKASFVATKAGVVEFSIAMQSDYGGTTFPGEYQVKVHVMRKADK